MRNYADREERARYSTRLNQNRDAWMAFCRWMCPLFFYRTQAIDVFTLHCDARAILPLVPWFASFQVDRRDHDF